jgi:hypothetical protein
MGGVPPMMPPMGGAGMGPGGGGGPRPGSGATQRQGGRPRGGPAGTPGLPALLQGKAGKKDASFAMRPRQREEAAPATVQLIDEDMWQVESSSPANRRAN